MERQHQLFGVNLKIMEFKHIFVWRECEDPRKKLNEIGYHNISSARRQVVRSSDVLPALSHKRNEIVNDESALCFLTQSC